jgi:hypothetical protein
MFDWLIEWMGGPATAQALSGVLGVFTASMAVVIALWNGIITRKNARLSVAPALALWANYPGGENNTCVVRVGNKGFGPAVVESFVVFNNGNMVGGTFFDKMRNLIDEAFEGYLVSTDYVSTLIKGHAFGSGDEVVIARFEVSPGLTRMGTDGFAQLMLPLSLVIRYRDIYRRKWAFVVHEFDGYTFRDAWWSPSYHKARCRFGSIITTKPPSPLNDRKAR